MTLLSPLSPAIRGSLEAVNASRGSADSVELDWTFVKRGGQIGGEGRQRRAAIAREDER
jgi:hypothetical protein